MIPLDEIQREANETGFATWWAWARPTLNRHFGCELTDAEAWQLYEQYTMPRQPATVE